MPIDAREVSSNVKRFYSPWIGLGHTYSELRVTVPVTVTLLNIEYPAAFPSYLA